jgi:ribulose-phosphate 3-epimerase
MNWDDLEGVAVEPSLYAADFSRLGEQVEELLEAGARVFHFDVGDGHFVPPITVGPVVLKWIAPLVHGAGGLLDCHLMVQNPKRHVEAFAEAGADGITVHVEVSEEPAALVALAGRHGLAAGLAVNPDTAVETAVTAADGFALVNCMSVYPGYSGQAFIPGSVERVRRLRELLPENVKIQVDGGVGADNAAALREAGADVLVAATSIFGDRDPPAAYRHLVDIAA